MLETRLTHKVLNRPAAWKSTAALTIIVLLSIGIAAMTAAIESSSASSLPANPTWSKSGLSPAQQFGAEVTSAGDVNRDGYSDILIAAPDDSSSTGKAYLFLGSSGGLSNSYAWSRPGESVGDEFAAAVSSAGDVNGDGFADVIVGAPSTSADSGKAYLYLGSASGLASSPAWTVSGEAAGDRFGDDLASAGDVNGDGYSDVLVGAPSNGGGAGKVYLFLGSSTGVSTTPAWSQVGETASSKFGDSLATAGDVNADGYSDIVIGADGFDSSQGKGYLYLGSASGPSTEDAWIGQGETEGANFGSAVAAAGDVNGDGYTDVLVGADGESSDAGKTYLYLGFAGGLNVSAAWTITGDSDGGRLGASVASAGDVNGDGYADIVLGGESAAPNSGEALLFMGSPAGLASNASWGSTGDSEGSGYGSSVSSAGDVNGDGYSEILIGAKGSQSGAGAVHLYSGSSSPLGTIDLWNHAGQRSSAYAGSTLASAGDVNGDGYSDTITGADDHGYLYLGSSTGLSTTLDWHKTAPNIAIGRSVASAGDVNGDGYSDVVLGGPTQDQYAGVAQVYHGSASGLASSPGWESTGGMLNAYFGSSVASAGDVNGDGYSDVLVGSPGYYDRGRAALYMGSPSGLGAQAAWNQVGEAIGHRYGAKVASAGDVNRDGYSDVLIGAHGPNQAGKAYLYYGSASGLRTTPGWAKTGEASGAYFMNVASAGDVNGDGYSDFLIGAGWHDSGRGKAYLFTGSSTGPSSIPVWTKQGEHASFVSEDLNVVKRDHFGDSVSSAGDINGDGFSDVIIGASGSQNQTGKSYLYLGSISGLGSSESWSATSDAAVAAVSSAGDANGDGYSDALILSNGGTYLYRGNGGGAGVSMLPRQRKTLSDVSIPAGSFTDSTGSIKLSALAKNPFGKTRSKIEFEVKPVSSAFNGIGTVKSPAWGYGEDSAMQFSLLISGLAQNTMYKWRARILYHPAGASPQQAGRWFSPQRSTVSPANFRTKKESVRPTANFAASARAAGSYVRGTFPIPAVASDTGGSGLARVELYDGAAKIAQDISYPYAFGPNTANLANGPHSFKLRSIDGVGNVSPLVSRSYIVDNTPPVTRAPYAASGRRYTWVRIYYKVVDSISPSATVSIQIKDTKGKTVKTLLLGSKPTNRTLYHAYKIGLPKGSYRFYVFGKDRAGNQQKILGTNKLTVR